MKSYNRSKLGSSLLLCGLLGITAAFGDKTESSPLVQSPHHDSELEMSFHLGWDSRYLSEGRDALDGDSLISGSVAFGWRKFSGGIWYGYSPDQRYDEVQLSLAYTESIGDFEFSLGYTHLQFPFENTHDDEVGFGVVWSGLPSDIELSAEVYYSFDADGYFAEIAAGKEFSVTDELTVSLTGVYGINQDYVSDGHDGANHFALSLGLEYALTDNFSITAHTTYSWALDRDSTLAGDEQLVDFFHAGVGLRWSF